MEKSLNFLGYPKYTVDIEGIVKNSRGHIIKPYLNNDGYLYVQLRHLNKPKRFKVHRLVALAFMPNPHNLPQVNHKDGDKLNCTETNLEWATGKTNCLHYVRNLTEPKITLATARWIRLHYVPYDKKLGCVPLAARFNVTPDYISQIVRNDVVKE